MSPKRGCRLAAALALSACWLSSCMTTTKESTSFSMEDSRPSSILDSRLKKLSEDLHAYPKRHDLHYQMAAIYFRKEAYHESAAALTRAIELAPGDSKYHYHLGRVYLKSNDLELAEAQFREAARLMPPKRYSGPHAALGLVLGLKRDFEGALKEFEKCVEIEPEDPVYYYFIGSLCDKLGKSEAAIRFLQEYLARGGKTYRRKTCYILEKLGVKVEPAEAKMALSDKEPPTEDLGRDLLEGEGDGPLFGAEPPGGEMTGAEAKTGESPGENAGER